MPAPRKLTAADMNTNLDDRLNSEFQEVHISMPGPYAVSRRLFPENANVRRCPSHEDRGCCLLRHRIVNRPR